MRIRPHLSLATAVALTFTLSACGDDDTDDATTPAQPAATATADDAESDDTATDEDHAAATDDAEGTAGDEDLAAYPVTVDTALGEVTLEEQPERIVSLSPSATEILFAIGAGDQVVATDEYSTYPEEAPTTDLSGFEPNVEAIIGYEPDLVVIANDMNDIVASLEAADIPVILNPAPSTIEEGWDGMAALGLATGHADETADTIADLRQQIEDAFASAPEGADLRVYHELSADYYSASSSSFIGDVYAQFGAENVADEADTDGTGYPQLTEEAIVAANPQLIVITDQAGYTAEDVADRPGWAEIEAVEGGDIVVVEGDVASRWGPRLPQLVQTVADAMNEVSVPAGR